MTTPPQRPDEAAACPAHVVPSLVVPSTSAWVHRCAKRMLELDPELDPLAAMHTVDDMATSARWRAMHPETVAEALYAAEPGDAPRSFASRAIPHV